ncbi:hypothetical protein GS416_06410 [Rhodococcus hoagii]|nr:hypothetical protein [Prescottella equi]
MTAVPTTRSLTWTSDFWVWARMGRPMARNLARAGYDVTVWNRSPARPPTSSTTGVRGARSCRCASQVRRVQFTGRRRRLHRVGVVGAVVAGRETGFRACQSGHGQPGKSGEAEAALNERGIFYVAAPVFGRAEVAEAGQLTVLAAGDPGAIDVVAPMLDVIGRRTWRIGEDPAQANVVKILGNY